MKRLEVLSYMPLVSDGMVDDKGWSKGARMRTSMARVEMETDEFLDENDPVQVAIFELEREADDAIIRRWDFNELSFLADLAFDEALATAEGFAVFLEAAALLRDGWRPEGWSR